MRIKSHSKINTHNKECLTHNKECLVKVPDKKIQRIRRNKTQTESKQNRKTCFCENKTSWLYSPVSFCVFCFWMCLLS